MMRRSTAIALGFTITCALLSLGQLCGAAPTPTPNPNPGNPPPVTACGLVGNNCTVDVGTEPNAIVAADFDRDGDQDLAISLYGGDTIAIALNNGVGFFTVVSNFAAGDGPAGLTAQDLNADGFADLITASTVDVAGLGYSVFANQGLGSFKKDRSYTTGSPGVSIALGDLNGDTVLDIAIANPFGNTISLAPGTGGGRFGTTVPVDLTNRPRAVVAGDFDGDGDIDLAAVTELGNAVAFFRNSGGGSFFAPTLSIVGTAPMHLAAADLDRDGDLDLVTANFGTVADAGDTISVLLNNGNGVFAGARNLSVGANPGFVKIADFNADNRLDLAIACNGTGKGDAGVAVLIGTGNGSFGAPTLYPAGIDPVAVEAADLDGDGDIDLAAVDFIGGQVYFLGNDGKGSFVVAE